ncbi:aldehyde oxidase GLOX-like [Amaranthus tricolor]|uniref:aldehyde oxidase GLOX-like n=1 Tax=Amaranthus tricolor TaxID=29722 RepID=UPI00258E9CC4|nr:aldehyde oxidase GLOX-like [Amaranthus tricolor]
MGHNPYFATILLFTFSFCIIISSQTSNIIGKDGEWELIRENVGVVAMHMALTHKNTVLIFDQTGSGPSAYLLKHRAHGGDCHVNHPNDIKDSKCFAHSVEYHIDTDELRPLRIEADPFCSSGSFLRNGTLLQTGGYANGYKKIRYFQPCDNRMCDWRLAKIRLTKSRWYASNHLLPGENERVIIVGGKKVWSYEFVPKRSPNEVAYTLPFLHQTYNKSEGGNNLYPFLHLSSNGHLFIFANRDSILFDYRLNQVVKTYPRIPGGGSRNYPSSGSSVILPLDHQNGFQKVEVMVCGGASEGAFSAALKERFLEGLKTCGRMVITGNSHVWNMEAMPHARLLSDMVILPTGHILIINGAKRGAGGWNNADSPANKPFLYKPKNLIGERFSVLKETNIPRMYHSSAILLPNGKVLIGGSNPNKRYVYNDVKYPTELRLQTFAPQYTDHRFNPIRPSNISVLINNEFQEKLKPIDNFTKKHTTIHNNGTHHSIVNMPRNNTHKVNGNKNHHHVNKPKSTSHKAKGDKTHHHLTKLKPTPHKANRSSNHHIQSQGSSHKRRFKKNSIRKDYKNDGDSMSVRYGDEFKVRFWVKRRLENEVQFNAYAPPFTTHSVAMNQRLLKLKRKKLVQDDDGWVSAIVEAPPSANVAPSGYYMLFLVNNGIPSTAQWIKFVHATTS